MTACVIFSPSFASASAFSFARIIALISGGENVLRLAADLHLDVRVAVGGLHDFVRHAMLFLVHFVELAAHETLDRENRVVRVGDGLAFRGLADEPLAGLGKCDDGRRGACAFRFSSTTGSPPSMTAMQELVVPRSIPKTLP